MLKLTTPVAQLPRIGPRYAKLLENLAIFTVEDLLYHFPFRYEDYTARKTISAVSENELATLVCKLTFIQNIFTKTGKRLTLAQAEDETGKLSLVWFNQQYLLKVIKPATTYIIRGKVIKYNYKKTIISPQLQLIDAQSVANAQTSELAEADKPTIVAVYPETTGITSRFLSHRINDVLFANNREPFIHEFLPEQLRKKHELIGLVEALQTIHQPKALPQTDQARARLAYDELLFELLKVETRKHQWHHTGKGVCILTTTVQTQLTSFISSLPFELTQSQHKVLGQIYTDLASTQPMNRLLQGDVGSGKTIVALLAAYAAILNGYSVLYLAPTEILAQQHFETFTKFLSQVPCPSYLCTKSAKLPKHLPPASIIIGTHALLFSSALPQNIGLVIIDEQHRFGVEQRAKLLTFGTPDQKANFLAMTATPIPRTLALTIYGDLDISIIDEVPNKTKKITTKVVSDRLRQQTFEWIKAKNEQTFIVCPFIETSEATDLENVKAAQTEFKKLSEGIFKDLKLGLLHGRMKQKEKDSVLTMFKTKELQVLVSTPVIETGIDIPEAVVMVVESAERYGLASLHQLRGRVGRGVKEGYCFLFTSSGASGGHARLKNMEKITDGLKLAELDLSYRGQGDVFGTMQSGFKNLRLVDLSDLALVEKVKKDAQELLGQLKTTVPPDLMELSQKLATAIKPLVESN